MTTSFTTPLVNNLEATTQISSGYADMLKVHKEIAISYNEMLDSILPFFKAVKTPTKSKWEYYKDKVVDSSPRRPCKFVHYMKFKHILKRK